MGTVVHGLFTDDKKNLTRQEAASIQAVVTTDQLGVWIGSNVPRANHVELYGSIMSCYSAIKEQNRHTAPSSALLVASVAPGGGQGQVAVADVATFADEGVVAVAFNAGFDHLPGGSVFFNGTIKRALEIFRETAYAAA